METQTGPSRVIRLAGQDHEVREQFARVKPKGIDNPPLTVELDEILLYSHSITADDGVT